MTPAIDAHVRLDTHPTHPSAVQAVLTGSQAHVALMALEAAGWSAAATNVFGVRAGLSLLNLALAQVGLSGS
ncbi:hypothetical protein SAMN06272771_6454 [Streptomyces sp. Ag82_O1-12]|nr:hypothetical protein SAMN06272771_6454 [Streptomyces sp. Ag82_O1-12]SOD48995.1 hypothetical protein SAMN06272727_6458 [Streptomyces sp. Ag82_G6-1]